MSLYKVLDLEDGASLEQIKKSYRKLARENHPDKTNDISKHTRFLEINSAYEILSNDKSRMEYIKLPDENKNKFQEFLSGLFGHNIDIDSLSGFGINLTKDDMEYVKSDIHDILKKLNLKEIFKFFKDGILPRKDFDNFSLCSDSDVDFWNNDEGSYFDMLPLIYQNTNDYTLNIIHNITLKQLINAEKVNLTLKRKQYSEKSKSIEFKNTKFSFNVKNQWIVFNSGGDVSQNAEYYGDLIIKLMLPKMFDWQDNIILYQKKINLYQFVYGVNINLSEIMLNEKKEIYWVPIRDGNLIFLDYIGCHQIFVKLIVELNHSDATKNVLKDYFDK